VTRRVDDDRFPEWRPFADAVQRHGPDAGTWCEAWTVRDIVVHQAGNAEELARVLGGHLAGQPVATRGFEEREGPLRALNDADLWDALLDRMAALGDVAEAAEGVPADTDVAWTGRTMKVTWSAEHMRDELGLHRVENPSHSSKAVSLHLYSPPFKSCQVRNLFRSCPRERAV